MRRFRKQIAFVAVSALAPALLDCASAFGAGNLVANITSFVPLEPGSLAAEICGNVTESGSTQVPPEAARGQVMVTVTVDPGSKAGTYQWIAGPDGKFCGVVFTYRDRAEARAWLAGTDAAHAVPTSLAPSVAKRRR